MVNEARAYRERVLSELTRRRELARQQIEQLILGRDRLLQVFERARLVAVDVVAELTPLGEPEEYVDLSPTTGPVPMMVPARSLTGSADRATDRHRRHGCRTPGRRRRRRDRGTVPRTTRRPTTRPRPRPTLGPARAAGSKASSIRPTIRRPWRPPDATTDDAPTTVPTGHRRPTWSSCSPTRPRPKPIPTPARCSPGCGRARPTTPPVRRMAERLPSPTSTAAAETIFDRRDAALVPLIVAGARKLKRVLADEQNDVLDALRKAVAVTELSAILPPDSKHADRYADAIGDELLAAAVAGAGTTGAAFAGRAAQVARQVLHPRPGACRDRGRPRRTAPRPARAAASPTVRATTKTSPSASAPSTASGRPSTSTTSSTTCSGSRTGRARSPRPAPARGCAGRSIRTVRPCPDAEDNALAGPVEAGDAYPTGHTRAPAHAGCRCLLAPVPN